MRVPHSRFGGNAGLSRTFDGRILEEVAREGVDEGSGLDRLNEAAVSSPREEPHRRGMSYHELFESLGEVGDAILWGRQMVLGPTPEFCADLMSP